MRRHSQNWHCLRPQAWLYHSKQFLPKKLQIILLLFLVLELSENLHRKLLWKTLSEQAFTFRTIAHSMVYMHMHTAENSLGCCISEASHLILRQHLSLSWSLPIRPKSPRSACLSLTIQTSTTKSKFFTWILEIQLPPWAHDWIVSPVPQLVFNQMIVYLPRLIQQIQ